MGGATQGPPAFKMKVDAHQHFWRYDTAQYGWIDDTMAALRRDFLPGDLAPLLRGAGFDACVAVQARQTLEETRVLLDLAERHPFVAGVVGWVDLCAPGVDAQLEAFRGRPRLVGLRHVVQAEADDRFLLRPDFGRGVAAALDRGLAYDILVYPRQLPAAVEFAARFPGQRLVLDHLGKPDIRTGRTSEWECHLRRLAALPHVHAKLSGLVTEADWAAWTPDQVHRCLDVAYDCFGAGRLMIGSDWPVCTVAADYGRTMDVVASHLAGRPAVERDAVLGGNAARFYRLSSGGAEA